MSACLQCGEDAHHSCSACKDAVYCSVKCQGIDWKAGHGITCGTKLDDAVSVITSAYKGIVEKQFEGKTPVKPTLIIAYGPPGSGKSTVVKKLYDNPDRRIREDEFVDIDVDRIVDAIPGYKEERAELKPGDREGKVALYMRARAAADPISENVFDEALLKKYSVRFETTGRSVTWITGEIDRIKRMGYRIWIVYPVVEMDELKLRIKRREELTGQVAMPDSMLSDLILKSRYNLSHLLNQVDRTIIYDNTTKSTLARTAGRILFELETRYNTPETSGNPIGKTVSCVICSDGKDDPDKRAEDRRFYRQVLGDTLYEAVVSKCETCMRS